MAADDSVDQNDLKKVKGIGAKVEARLKDAGITSLGQLARTPVNELAAVLDGLTGKYDAHRIHREKWVSQATALATVPAARPAEDEPAKRVRHNFTVEVQLAVVGRDVVSSKVVHVQTGDEATWAGWEGQRVVAFIEDRAGLGPPAPDMETKRDPPPATEPAPGTSPGARCTSSSASREGGRPGRRAWTPAPARAGAVYGLGWLQFVRGRRRAGPRRGTPCRNGWRAAG